MSETAPTAKAIPAVAFCFLLNQLLEREGWARERLARFAGRCVELRPPLLPPLRLAIGEGGRIEPGDAALDAILTVEGVSGSGEFADELRDLAKSLRWDFEEELSHVFGDVAGERIGGTLRAFGRWQLDVGRRLGEAVGDYATGDSGTLLRRGEFRQFAARVDELVAAIDRLERRLV